MKRALLLLLLSSLLACETTQTPTPEEPERPEQTNDPDGSADESHTVATGNAVRGPWEMNESDFHYVDDPSVAIADDGTIAVVWADNEAQDVFFQRYSPEGEAQLSEPVNVSRSPEVFSWLPRVAFGDSSDEVFVLTQDIVFSGGSHGGEVFFVRSLDGGESFEDPLNLSETTAGAGKGRLTADNWSNGNLDLLIGPGGEVYVAWTEYEGLLRFRRSLDAGENFEPAFDVFASDETPARGPALALDSEGRLFIAFTVGEDDGADIHLALSDDGGQSFGEPTVALSTAGHADAPALFIDADDTLHLVFADAPDGRFQRYRILYASSDDQGQTFSEPQLLSGELEGSESAHFPSLAGTPDGELAIVWEHYEDYGARPTALMLTRSQDSGERFSTPTLISATEGPAGGLQGLFMQKVAVSPDGEVVVVHSHFIEGEESRILLLRSH